MDKTFFVQRSGGGEFGACQLTKPMSVKWYGVPLAPFRAWAQGNGRSMIFSVRHQLKKGTSQSSQSQYVEREEMRADQCAAFRFWFEREK